MNQRLLFSFYYTVSAVNAYGTPVALPITMQAFKVDECVSWTHNGNTYDGVVIAVSPNGVTLTVWDTSWGAYWEIRIEGNPVARTGPVTRTPSRTR